MRGRIEILVKTKKKKKKKIVFFFKQKTAYEIYQCDWSSDVCSSDLSPSESTSGAPQPHTPGTLLAGSSGHPSHASPKPSVSVSNWSVFGVSGQLSSDRKSVV